jgi:predicted amidohydrolase
VKRVAAIQMASGSNVNANLLEVERLVSKAADAGAGLVVLPENFAIMGLKEGDKVSIKEPLGDGPIQRFLTDLAIKYSLWIVGGTIPVASPNPDKVYAACLLINDKGEIVANYNKLHLFDVTITENGEEYNESATIEAGNNVVVVDTPFGRLGMAICYDLRFPGFFRGMQDQDVDIITIPAAFTKITGKAHWDILVRARAIENLAFVVASAQGGYHVNGRETYGHSMIVDPWGNKLDELPRGSGIVFADLDMDRQKDIRKNFPVLKHRKIMCSL